MSPASGDGAAATLWTGFSNQPGNAANAEYGRLRGYNAGIDPSSASDVDRTVIPWAEGLLIWINVVQECSATTSTCPYRRYARKSQTSWPAFAGHDVVGAHEEAKRDCFASLAMTAQATVTLPSRGRARRRGRI